MLCYRSGFGVSELRFENLMFASFRLLGEGVEGVEGFGVSRYYDSCLGSLS